MKSFAISIRWEVIGIILWISKNGLLGLTTLSLIGEVCDLIYKNHNKKIIIEEISLEDSKAYSFFKQGFTAGIFQFESVGMTRYVMDLKPNSLEEITAMNALYRPGPMNWIPVYIAKKFNKTPNFQMKTIKGILVI